MSEIAKEVRSLLQELASDFELVEIFDPKIHVTMILKST